MSTGKLPLRILYSLNGSAQYILARSQGAVPIEFIPSSHGNGTGASSSCSPLPRYASASLKTCLNAICRSSPEIIQDPSRDFSVYLLDPLEIDCVPAQSSQPSVPEAPESQVAVGLGLMSWALMTDEADAIPVTGTLKVSGAGQEMLEIIFSLRQTLPMQQASLPEALRSWSKGKQPTTLPEKGRKPVPYHARRPPRTTAIPVTESDKILAVAPIYVGPERRPQGGRQIAQPKSIEPAYHDGDDVVVVDGPHRRNNPGKDPSPLGNDPSGPSSLLDFLAFINVITPELERNKALGNVLGLVHGSDGTAIHHPPAELANAMTLLSDLQRHYSQPDNALSSHNQHRRKSSSNDDEIVCLNKENVNPKVFRRRAEREKGDPQLPGSGELSTVAPSSGLPSPANQSHPPTRKRTLSEFMAEQESIQDKEKALKRPQYYRTERSMSSDSFLHDTIMPPPATAPRQIKPSHPPKSSRRRTNSCASSPGRGFFTETAIAVPPRPSTSASSPIRPPRKSFILPDWAQTDTATKPRLSDRTVEKMQADEAKKREDELKKRRKHYQETREKGGKRCKPGTRPSTSATATVERQVSTSTRSSTKPGAEEFLLPAPVAASAEFPAFVREQTSRPPFAALPFGSPSRSAQANNIPPRTPPRTAHSNTIATPEAPSSLFTPDANSLFTPVPGSWEARGVLDLGRRSMSPSSRRPPPQETEQIRPSERPESEESDLGQEWRAHVQTEQMPSSSQGYDSDDSEDDDAPPRQHWVGLPPSSPPPLSSPYLGPSPMEDDDVEESPLATPDAEPVSEQETFDTPDTEVTNYSVEELGKLLNIEDLASLFESSATDTDTASFFDQFVDSNLVDGSQPTKEWGLDGTSPDFDFSEFWESVKPLVEGSTQPLDMNLGGAEETNGVDHSKLAGDVHALFSGCLV
ncbi:hypothetical protein B0H12DRAFT_1144941 [Mycena haematopus]|nr:hypothetical protein B0H12DRAFT_1144941 [Mycena haematopus]